MAIEKVKEYFRKYDMDNRIQEFEESSATVELAAKALNCEPKRIAKTLSFKVDEQPILIVVAGDAKIDNAKYKAKFNKKAKMLAFDEVESIIGHAVGGVCPFAINDGIEVYLDESLKRFETIYPACGSSNSAIELTIEELEKRVNILMKHELKNALVSLNIETKINPETELKGNINSLVQVINNMISNAIQCYNGKPDEKIDMVIDRQENNIVISITDYGSGLPKEVEKKLFKEMITTKGKNGTGLGLFMSYSNIRAHFNGNITFKTKQGEGTTFYITLPME